jgi:hypothetical protein
LALSVFGAKLIGALGQGDVILILHVPGDYAIGGIPDRAQHTMIELLHITGIADSSHRAGSWSHRPKCFDRGRQQPVPDSEAAQGT